MISALAIGQLLLAFLLRSSLAQIISTGQCPEHPVVQNFDLPAYLGEWYEINRYEQNFQRGGECSKAAYALNDDGTVRVDNRMLIPPSDQFDVEIGFAVVSFPEDNLQQAKLNVSFRGMPPNRSNYWVLDTDYTTFSFVWSCFEVSDTIKGESHWLLSRTPELPESARSRVEELTDLYLDRRHVRPTRQDSDLCNVQESRCVLEGSVEN
ncbi:apolipoprotein D-like [Malaya genurostris]|uniref:apolipoprotein D-like n=1 Tax=Malaya genurostris TaxID=325434 RepID=UPI0026F40732|nr:apolipoprotein D-like [Malaya genurostris]